MRRVTSTKQLTRGQKVARISKSNGLRIGYYRFISEDLTDNQELKERYGYFADFADCPRRFYLAEENGEPLFMEYTEEDILREEQRYYEEEMAEINLRLTKVTPDREKGAEQ